MKQFIRGRNLRSCVALVLVNILGGGVLISPAHAQSQATNAPSGAGTTNADSLQEVVVTGSRLSTGFTTPSPVTVVGAEFLEQTAAINVGQALTQLPEFRPGIAPTTNGFGSFNVGAQIADLRGLGPTRNLVLVDGRRFAPTTREGTVDLNLIPSLLVERIETVTGGASAAYGSDALAGVINVILNKSLTGFRSQVDYGVSDSGDGKNYHASLAGGADFAGGRGHFVAGGEYENQESIGNCFSRSWCKRNSLFSNPGFAIPGFPGYGQPANIRAEDNAGWWINSSGVVNAANNFSPAAAPIWNMFGTGGVTFDSSGTPIPFQMGSLYNFGLGMIGGDVYPSFTDSNLMVDMKRYTAFGHADYDFSDSLQGFLEGSFGRVEGSTPQTAFFAFSPIFRDNPFIPAAIRTLVGPPGPASGVRPPDFLAAFQLARVGDDIARGFAVSDADVYRVTTGLKGKFSSAWSWDAYYQYGHTGRNQSIENDLIVGNPLLSNSDPNSHANFSWASDVVTDPGTGAPICRALLSPDPALRAAAAGCVPFDPFGPGRSSAAAQDYVLGKLVEDLAISQHVAAGNVQGEVMQLPAGPWSVATGVEFRRDSIDVAHDPLSNAYAYFQNFGSDYNGRQDVIEGYLETEVPLARDAPFAKLLSLNGAVRQTHYDIEGFGSYLRADADSKFDATTWKLSLVYDPSDWFRLRATRSRDIRAPNFADLLLAFPSNFSGITNPFQGGAVGFVTVFQGGNPALNPEIGDTTTLGMVFQPHWAEGLRLSVDWYEIRINDYIGTAGAQNTVDRCAAGVSRACEQITFGPPGPQGATLAQIRDISVNLDYLQAEGIDIEAEYRLGLDGLNLPGNLTLRALATHALKNETSTYGLVVDRAGETGVHFGSPGTPDWLINAYVTYQTGPLSITAQGRYISSGTYNAQYVGPDEAGYSLTNPNSVTDNHMPSAFYMSLFGNFDFQLSEDRNLQLFFAVNNLLDKDPPSAPNFMYPTNPVYYDQIGRTYRVGLRFGF